ncbi:MAG: hypothetical protein K2X27_02220 [Candidatus Obscuribacterales bacterium]|nr:hypothetical protein [Candidatus Obscuribacterales bacterium]
MTGGDNPELGRLKEAAKKLKARIETEKLLSMRLRSCLELTETLCRQIMTSLNDEQLTCEIHDGLINVGAYDRMLTFVPANGIANDARLPRPRGLYCCQVLIFGHLEGQEEGRLLSSFRVYPDGSCTDGENCWKIEAHSIEFLSYLSELIASNLLDCDHSWPPVNEMPDSIKIVPLVRNRIESANLKHNCVGFECDLPAAHGTIANTDKH